jgi:hypothetical protein
MRCRGCVAVVLRLLLLLLPWPSVAKGDCKLHSLAAEEGGRLGRDGQLDPAVVGAATAILSVPRVHRRGMGAGWLIANICCSCCLGRVYALS